MFRLSQLLLPLLLISLHSFCQNAKTDWSTPPNSVLIAENLYIDQTEMSNMNWLEFMYSAKRTVDNETLSSIPLIPDPTVWSKLNSCFQTLDKHYLRFPKTRNYPSVGISQEQARLYSTWRENVVFYSMLLQQRKIKPPTTSRFTMNPDSVNYFTIESYFEGDYPYINKKKKKATHYWKFDLPTREEFELAVAYNDSINKAYLANCQKKKCKECIEHFSQLVIANKNPCASLPPGQPVFPDCFPENAVLHLRDNVSEWLHEDGITAGGAWIHKKNVVLSSFLIRKGNTNAFTGFRNVAKWVKWGDNSKQE